MHLIMAQRLVRRLDEKTRVAYQPDANMKAQLQTVINGLPPNVPKPSLDNITLFKPGKSADNPFGYTGQIAIREQMQMTPRIQLELRKPVQQITTETLQAAAVQDGMLTMMQDGVLKALSGVTTVEEVYRVIG
jgi:type II secretory ATPase GspE/PulE/Tfp pilus assembly ATPase PilB-like protein